MSYNLLDDYLFRVESPNFPAQNAVRYLDTDWAHHDRYRLINHRTSYYTWVGSHWQSISDVSLGAQVYKRFMDAVYMVTKKGKKDEEDTTEAANFGIDPRKSAALMQGILNHVLIDERVNTPTWLDGDTPVADIDWAAREMISCSNVLVNSRTRETHEHTPRFFNHVATTFPYQPDAPPAVRWLRFLHDTFPDDQEAIDTLQEIFGYLLTSRTDLQKIFLIIGRPGSGKGTIIRTLTALLGGDEAVSSVSLADLNERFGLADIATKQVAIMQDARFRSRDDGRAVERILSISGQDPVSVELKGRNLYTGRLPTRFVLVSNELPQLRDESGAIRRRLLLLHIARELPDSQQDPELTDKLQTELPSILNWALDGLDRLNARGKTGFIQPGSGQDQVVHMTHLASPTISFVEQCCEIGSGLQVSKRELFQVFCEWAKNSKNLQVSENVFARNLYAASPGVKPKRGSEIDSETGTRVQLYAGIGLGPAGEKLLDRLKACDWFGSPASKGSGSTSAATQGEPEDPNLPSI